MKKAGKVFGIILNILFIIGIFGGVVVLYACIISFSGDATALSAYSKQITADSFRYVFQSGVTNPFASQTAILSAAGSLVAVLVFCFEIFFLKDICGFLQKGIPFDKKVEKNFLYLAAIHFSGGILSAVITLLCDRTIQKSLEAMSAFNDSVVQSCYAVPDTGSNFLFVTGIYFTLFFVFRYGRELQTLSDETL